MTIRWGRVLRLGAIGIFGASVLITVGLAWAYVHTLTHPTCPAFPAPVDSSHQSTDLRLQTEDRLDIGARFYTGTNGAAVIAVGGQSGAIRGGLPLVQPLLKQGYSVLQLDSRACASPPARVTLGYFEVLDVGAGLAYLQSLPEIDPDKIGIIGFSMGGVTAIRAAGEMPGIQAVVAEGGFYNLGEDIIDGDSQVPLPRRLFFYLISAVFELQTGISPWEISPIDSISQISPRPVLLIYGEHELTDGRGEAQYAAARDPKSLWVVPGGSHGRNHLVAPEAYAQTIVEFLDQSLGD